MKMTTDNRTSSSYRMTVDMVDGQVAPNDLGAVQDLRALVKKHNSLPGSNKMYVKLQGRGPRPSRRYHQSLPLGMATSADVYVYDR